MAALAATIARNGLGQAILLKSTVLIMGRPHTPQLTKGEDYYLILAQEEK